MNFEQVRVEPRMTYLVCPDCGKRLRHMENTFSIVTHPPKAWYTCDNHHQHLYYEGYPRVEYVRSDD